MTLVVLEEQQLMSESFEVRKTEERTDQKVCILLGPRFKEESIHQTSYCIDKPRERERERKRAFLSGIQKTSNVADLRTLKGLGRKHPSSDFSLCLGAIQGCSQVGRHFVKPTLLHSVY